MIKKRKQETLVKVSKKKVTWVFIVNILLFFGLYGITADEVSDFYNDTEELFSVFEDPNSGLTIFPTLRIPTGGRLEGLGTAYTGLSADTGALESNPAGSSLIQFSELALSSHPWIADSSLMGMAYVSRTGNLGFGAGAKFLNLPFTEYNAFGEKAESGYFTETIGTLNFSYNFLKSYNFAGIALGSNIKAAYRTLPGSRGTGRMDGALMADFGLLSGFNNLMMGVALKNLGITNLTDPLPLQLSTGLAFMPFNPLLISADFILPLSLDPVNYPAGRWELAAGLDIKFTSFLSLQTGFRLNANPRVSIGFTAELARVIFVTNYNVDLSGSLNPADKFSIQARIKLGKTYKTTTPPVIRIADKKLLPVNPGKIKTDMPEPEKIPIKETDPGEYVLENVNFDRKNNDIEEESFAYLDDFARELKKRDDITVLISAYTEFESNPVLEFDNCSQRAINIKEYLKDQGIDEERLKVSATGWLVRNDDEKKVVIKVLPKDRDELNKLKKEIKQRLEDVDMRDENLSGSEKESKGDKLQIARLINGRKGDFISFSTITFEEDSVDLKGSSFETLDGIAESLVRAEETIVLVITYSRFKRSIIEEIDLCVSRAFVIKNYLVGKGVGSSQVKISNTGNIAGNSDSFKVDFEILETGE